MRTHAPIAFILAVLGAALGSLLVIGVPLAYAEATPLIDSVRPITGPVNTTSMAAVIAAGIAALVAIALYASLVLRRETAATPAAADVTYIDAEDASRERRKAA